MNENSKQESLPVWLYAKEMHCPSCGRSFIDSYPRYTRLRMEYIESDLRPHYVSEIFPFLYDVSVCFNCGYARLTDCFSEMNEWQREKIRKEILPKFHSRNYPLILNREQAAERYKLAELSAYVMGLKDSEMGYLLLRTAWFSREDTEGKTIKSNQEMNFSAETLRLYRTAVAHFEKAYISEEFPIRGMNELTLAYVIAALHYRLENYGETKKWLKECYLNRDFNKKENQRIQLKVLELRQAARTEMKEQDEQAGELRKMEEEALLRQKRE